MAKLARESRLREKREDKKARRLARKEDADARRDAPLEAPDALEPTEPPADDLA